MTAATANRITPHRNADQVGDPMAADAVIYAGTLYALDADGYAVPAGTTGAGDARAVAEVGMDNTGGADGDETVPGRIGCSPFDNSAAADEITRADIGATAYVVDDQTVAKTDGAGTRRRAGIIMDVDALGVWVQVGAAGTGRVYLAVQGLDLVGANAAVARLVAPIAGDITAIRSVLAGGALATGNATLTAAIGATAVTGGVVTITQAGSAAGDVDAATPTAARTVAVGDVINITVGGTNTASRTANLIVEISH